jgi:purine-binding chemotaxis protein CheW
MKNGYQFVTFQIGNEYFGIDIDGVQEIVRVPQITKIPRSPSYVRGITNLRGDVFPVIDSHMRFNLESATITKSSRLIVVHYSGQRTGLIVDRITEVVRLSKHEIEPPPELTKGINDEYLKGVVNFSSEDDGKEYLLMILNLASFCKISIVEEKQVDFIKASSFAEPEKIDEEQLVSFFLSGEEYAIQILGVKEIIRLSDIVRIPNSPDYVKGLIYHREKFLPVIDLRNKFDLKLEASTDSSRIMIIDLRSISIGLIVDRVRGIIRIQKSVIQPPPTMITETESRELFGIAKLNKGQRLIMLIDLERIISYEDLKKIEESSEENKDILQKVKKDSAEIKKINLADEDNYIVFRLDKEEFGIHIMQVLEINRIQTITKLPNAPAFVSGVLNLRSEVIPVVNLRKRFRMDSPVEDEDYFYNARVIVLDISGKKSGLLVDSVSEVIRIDKRAVEPIPEVIKSNVSTEYMSSIVRIQNKNRMLILMNLEKILTEEEKKEFLEFSEKNKPLLKTEISGEEIIEKQDVATLKKMDDVVKESEITEHPKKSNDINEKKSDSEKTASEKIIDSNGNGKKRLKNRKTLKRAR